MPAACHLSAPKLVPELHRDFFERRSGCHYKGTVWATWDPEAPPFLEYLGDFVRYLDLTLDAWDGSDGGTEILCGIQKWRVPCNWKFPAEKLLRGQLPQY